MATTDPISPIAPARVRALLLPVGKISKSTFEGFARQMQSHSIVRLGDVTPDARPDRTMFSPLAFPDGKVIFDFSSCLPPASLLISSTVELFREVLVVIGIANGSAYTPTVNAVYEDVHDLQEAMGRAREQFPKALSLNLILFNVSDAAPFKNLPSGTLTVPPLAKTHATIMKTIMCDITGMLLAEMAIYAKNIANLQNFESLNVSPTGHGSNPHKPWSSNQTVDRSFANTSSEELSGPMTTIANGLSGPSRVSTPLQQSPPLIPSSGLSAGSKYDSIESEPSPPPALTFHAIMSNEVSSDEPITKRASQIQQADTSRETSRDRRSILGQGISSVNDRAKHQLKIRQGIITGTLYLHAGRWHDALRELVESTTRARAYSDHLWHAKGLENVLVTMLLLLWTESEFQIPSICYPTTEKSFSSMIHLSSKSDDASKKPSIKSDFKDSMLIDISMLIPDLLNMVMNIHIRAHSSKGETLPQFAFSECTIRFAYLMSLVCQGGSRLTNSALHHIVTGTHFLPTDDPTSPPRARAFSKHEIASFLFRAMPSLQPVSEVSVADSLIIYCGIARVLSLLKLARKRAFVVRKILVDLIPGLVQARKVGAAEAGIHPAAGFATWNEFDAEGNFANSVAHQQDLGLYIRDLLQIICQVHGIFVGGPTVIGNEESIPTAPGDSDAIIDSAASDKVIGTRLKELNDESTLQSFGGIGLKTDVLQLCANICEALPDFAGVLKFTIAYLRAVGPGIAPKDIGDLSTVQISKEEQFRVASKISRTVGMVKTGALAEIECRYWDDFLIRGIHVADPELSLMLTSHNSSDLKPFGQNQTSTDVIEHGPFIYDPFTKPKPKASFKNVIARGEKSSFVVALQNLYDFDVFIEEIQILTEGVKLECLSQSFGIGPRRIHHQTIIASALECGAMHLVGCQVKIRGCNSHEFLLFDKPWYGVSTMKAKSGGLAASSLASIQTRSTSSDASVRASLTTISPPVPSRVPIHVIESQPILAITSTSITQSAFMILEGETKSLFVTVQNLSDSVAVDFIHISSQDSTLALLEAKLNANLGAVDLYEVKYQATHRQALQWRSRSRNHEILILPGDCATFEIEVFGKPGLTDASVRIDYAYVGAPVQGMKSDFYTRHVSFPVVVTVNASVQLQKIEILPISSDLAWFETFQPDLQPNMATPSDALKSIASKEQKCPAPSEPAFISSECYTERSGFFLLLLELRNAWPRPLSLKIEASAASDEGKPEDARKAIPVYHGGIHVHPGHAARVSVVMPRMLLENSNQPIPVMNSTDQKQFVVASTSQSTTELAELEIFWYRQELLNKLRATWYESSTAKEGNIELRGLRLNPRMLEIMRQDIINVDMTLDAKGKPPVAIKQHQHSILEIETNVPMVLRIRLHNRSQRLVRPFLRLQPRLSNQPYNVALDLTRKLAWTGLLQQTGPKLKPGDTIDFSLNVCVLCSGTYEIGAVVSETHALEQAGNLGGRESRGDVSTSSDLPDELLVGRSQFTLSAREI